MNLADAFDALLVLCKKVVKADIAGEIAAAEGNGPAAKEAAADVAAGLEAVVNLSVDIDQEEHAQAKKELPS